MPEILRKQDVSDKSAGVLLYSFIYENLIMEI